jgi:hypothetical protein
MHVTACEDMRNNYSFNSPFLVIGYAVSDFSKYIGPILQYGAPVQQLPLMQVGLKAGIGSLRQALARMYSRGCNVELEK